MGEETLTTIEFIAVEECSALIQPEKQLACPTLTSSDFSFPKRKPSRTAPAGKQKIRVFSSQTPRSSAIAAVIASRHIKALSPDKALVYIKEFGVEDGSTTADAKTKKASVSAGLEKLYANWKCVERVIIVIDSRILREVVSRIFTRMFPKKQLPQGISDKLSAQSIRVSIDIESAQVKISRR